MTDLSDLSEWQHQQRLDAAGARRTKADFYSELLDLDNNDLAFSFSEIQACAFLENVIQQFKTHQNNITEFGYYVHQLIQQHADHMACDRFNRSHQLDNDL